MSQYNTVSPAPLIMTHMYHGQYLNMLYLVSWSGQYLTMLCLADSSDQCPVCSQHISSVPTPLTTATDQSEPRTLTDQDQLTNQRAAAHSDQ